MSDSVGNCWGRIIVNTLFTTGLAAFLFPGALLTIPPLEQKGNETLAQRTVFTGMVTWKAILVHMVLFLVVAFLWFTLMAAVWEMCPLA